MSKLIKPELVRAQSILWHPVATVRKYDEKGRLYETISCEGNELTTAGLNRVANVLVDGGNQALTETACRLGVGNDDTPFDPSDTDLGTSERYATMESGYPTVNGDEITFQSVFEDSEANFAWECWGIDVDTTPPASDGDTAISLFNRKVFSFGIKSGGTWTLTVVVGLSST